MEKKTHLVPPGTKMNLDQYNALKAKSDKTDQDYCTLKWFEEEFFNKSATLADEFKTNQLPKLLDEYADYIESQDAVQAIYAQVTKLDYCKGVWLAPPQPHCNHKRN